MVIQPRATNVDFYIASFWKFWTFPFHLFIGKTTPICVDVNFCVSSFHVLWYLELLYALLKIGDVCCTRQFMLYMNFCVSSSVSNFLHCTPEISLTLLLSGHLCKTPNRRCWSRMKVLELCLMSSSFHLDILFLKFISFIQLFLLFWISFDIQNLLVIVCQCYDGRGNSVQLSIDTWSGIAIKVVFN